VGVVVVGMGMNFETDTVMSEQQDYYRLVISE